MFVYEGTAIHMLFGILEPHSKSFKSHRQSHEPAFRIPCLAFPFLIPGILRRSDKPTDTISMQLTPSFPNSYINSAPATTPITPAALPTTLTLAPLLPVALAPAAPLVELAALACATCMPNPVAVVVTVLPPVVTVVVYTLLAVVLAVHPLHVVQGASVLQLPLVQPLHVEGGQPEVPHQAVQGPDVQALLLPQGPQPLAPKGPWPLPPFQPPGAPAAQAPFHALALSQSDASELNPDGKG